MVRNCFCLMVIAFTALVAQRKAAEPVRPPARQASGQITEFALPNPNSGPTTIAIAPDGTLWFTEATGNRIGRMAPDGSGIKEFELPHPGSAPRIITIGSDGNFWSTSSGSPKRRGTRLRI